MMYLGIVVRVDGNDLYVKVPDIGGKYQFGPLRGVISWYEDSYQTDTDPGGGAMVDVEKTTYYKKGDTVLVGQLGRVKEDLIVIGKVG